jgi:hypothetical protein
VNYNKKIAQSKYKVKHVDPKILDLSNFDVNALKEYPRGAKDFEIPLKVLNFKRLDYLELLSTKIAAYWGVVKKEDFEDKLKDLGFDDERKQLIFEYFCSEFRAAPLHISKFLHKKESGYYKLQFKNYHLNNQTAKSIACLIPWLVQVNEIEFDKNQINDHIAAVILLACYMNPSIKIVKI